MHNLSHKNEFYLDVNENSFSHERLCTKTRLKKEVQDNSENLLIFPLQKYNYEPVLSCYSVFNY